jgi:phosphate transport system protein
MFRELIKIMTEKTTLLEQMELQFQEMLKKGKTMFVFATNLLEDNREHTQDLAKNIFPIDQELNDLECKIRAEITTHISTAGADNLAQILIFLSSVKDAERIGDYVKNIYEIDPYIKNISQNEVGNNLIRIKNETKVMFDRVYSLFSNKGMVEREQLYNDIISIKKECQTIIDSLLDPDLVLDNKVAYALLTRYMKRVLAHLSNITAATISPVNKVGYTNRED